MSVPVSSRLRRYRRRILGWGSCGVVVLGGVGAPLFVRSVERDLEHRVPSELAERGFQGVSASFSGQDGVLRCATPMDEPEDVIDAAIDVWGVRAIELDRSCRVSGTSADVTDDATTTTLGGATGDSTPDAASDTASDTATGSSPAPGGDAADFGSIVDVVTTGPQFSILASLIDEGGMSEMLAGVGPFTLFAPTDAAFEAPSADRLGELRQDPDLVVGLLQHHVAAGSYPSGELVSGELEMLDGTSFTVTVAGGEITIGGAAVTEPDLSAGNGVVHVIDRVLLPGSTPTTPVDRDPSVSATLATGRIVLAGTVAEETQRAVLFDAASGVVDPASVDDQLVITAGATIDDAMVGALAELVTAMPPNLVSGESGVDGTVVYSIGVVVDDIARAAFERAAAAVSATVELVPRPTASGDDAAALEAELNEFVNANPILFAPKSADVSPDAFTVLDQVAGIAERFAGLTITIEGHTDSDGEPVENQTLSELRAAAVVDGLVARGVPAAGLESVGLGATQPIVADGVEDKDASRRVEFRVTTDAGP